MNRWRSMEHEHRVLVGTVAGILLLLLLPFIFTSPWAQNILFFALMYAALGTSWNLVAGYTGYISLATIAFFGLGAYGFAIAMDRTGAEGKVLPFLLVAVVGLAVTVISLPLAYLAYRSRGSAFILVTITYVLIFEYLTFNLRSLTGGSRGYRIPLPDFGRETFELAMYLAMWVVVTIGLLICWYLRSAPIGLAMFAVRDDEDRAAGIGVLTHWPKYVAFALAAFIAALAGALWAYRIGFIYPQFAFDPGPLLIGTVLMALFGGIGTLWGPTLGALILVPIDQELAFRLGGAQLYLLTYVLIFIAVMRLMPRGIIPTIADLAARVRRARQAQAVTPILPESSSAAPGGQFG